MGRRVSSHGHGSRHNRSRSKSRSRLDPSNDWFARKSSVVSESSAMATICSEASTESSEGSYDQSQSTSFETYKPTGTLDFLVEEYLKRQPFFSDPPAEDEETKTYYSQSDMDSYDARGIPLSKHKSRSRLEVMTPSHGRSTKRHEATTTTTPETSTSYPESTPAAAADQACKSVQTSSKVLAAPSAAADQACKSVQTFSKVLAEAHCEETGVEKALKHKMLSKRFNKVRDAVHLRKMDHDVISTKPQVPIDDDEEVEIVFSRTPQAHRGSLFSGLWEGQNSLGRLFAGPAPKSHVETKDSGIIQSQENRRHSRSRSPFTGTKYSGRSTARQPTVQDLTIQQENPNRLVKSSTPVSPRDPKQSSFHQRPETEPSNRQASQAPTSNMGRKVKRPQENRGGSTARQPTVQDLTIQQESLNRLVKSSTPVSPRDLKQSSFHQRPETEPSNRKASQAPTINRGRKPKRPQEWGIQKSLTLSMIPGNDLPRTAGRESQSYDHSSSTWAPTHRSNQSHQAYTSSRAAIGQIPRQLPRSRSLRHQGPSNDIVQTSQSIDPVPAYGRTRKHLRVRIPKSLSSTRSRLKPQDRTLPSTDCLKPKVGTRRSGSIPRRTAVADPMIPITEKPSQRATEKPEVRPRSKSPTAMEHMRSLFHDKIRHVKAKQVDRNTGEIEVIRAPDVTKSACDAMASDPIFQLSAALVKIKRTRSQKSSVTHSTSVTGTFSDDQAQVSDGSGNADVDLIRKGLRERSLYDSEGNKVDEKSIDKSKFQSSRTKPQPARTGPAKAAISGTSVNRESLERRFRGLPSTRRELRRVGSFSVRPSRRNIKRQNSDPMQMMTSLTDEHVPSHTVPMSNRASPVTISEERSIQLSQEDESFLVGFSDVHDSEDPYKRSVTSDSSEEEEIATIANSNNDLDRNCLLMLHPDLEYSPIHDGMLFPIEIDKPSHVISNDVSTVGSESSASKAEHNSESSACDDFLGIEVALAGKEELPVKRTFRFLRLVDSTSIRKPTLSAVVEDDEDDDTKSPRTVSPSKHSPRKLSPSRRSPSRFMFPNDTREGAETSTSLPKGKTIILDNEILDNSAKEEFSYDTDTTGHEPQKNAKSFSFEMHDHREVEVVDAGEARAERRKETSPDPLHEGDIKPTQTKKHVMWTEGTENNEGLLTKLRRSVSQKVKLKSILKQQPAPSNGHNRSRLNLTFSSVDEDIIQGPPSRSRLPRFLKPRASPKLSNLLTKSIASEDGSQSLLAGSNEERYVRNTDSRHPEQLTSEPLPPISRPKLAPPTAKADLEQHSKKKKPKRTILEARNDSQLRVQTQRPSLQSSQMKQPSNEFDEDLEAEKMIAELALITKKIAPDDTLMNQVIELVEEDMGIRFRNEHKEKYEARIAKRQNFDKRLQTAIKKTSQSGTGQVSHLPFTPRKSLRSRRKPWLANVVNCFDCVGHEPIKTP